MKRLSPLLARPLVILGCAVLITAAFVAMPWFHFFGISESGLELLPEIRPVFWKDYSILWLIPLAATLAGTAGVWQLFSRRNRQLTWGLALLAGLLVLGYYVAFALQGLLVDQTGTTRALGIGFWFALATGIVLILQAILLQPTPADPAISSTLQVKRHPLRLSNWLMLAAISLMLAAEVKLAHKCETGDTCDRLVNSLFPDGRAEYQPVPPAGADVTLVAAGDIASCGEDDGSRLTAKILDQTPGAVLALGDLAYETGSPDEFLNCYHPTWGRYRDRTFPAPGNHDYYSAYGISPYLTYFNLELSEDQTYYSFNLGAWHVISLDSNIEVKAGSPQEMWLRRDLSTNTAACTLAFWHHPLYSSGEHGNNPRMKAIWQDLYQAGVSVVLNGHDHDYERFAMQDANSHADPVHGIREFVVGTGGAEERGFNTIELNSEVRNEGTWGVLKMTLHPTSYDWQFIPVEGQTFTDSGSAACVSR